mmetsp:Transcript_38195/g.51693  ORF Transcript_38195/g.51693 Transcript_38195/m.51693 type:complete len:136 (-) Transcript_38195:463-870(-)|eukprot:CAMPEP_0185766956 /NCGR_PEP_ID=MMETSP1174-20130828/40438_1 /TAXON_ID=35687 /ORGANISM="Dictyocha speculum, Strain CCMP1381" /LENGTH=135 /DNA_ID=CAMNT_0028450903 /DNA_START=55 /DNA_END=462 /DNA_ORIENTATION=+
MNRDMKVFITIILVCLSEANAFISVSPRPVRGLKPLHGFFDNAFKNEEFTKPDRTAGGLSGPKKQPIDLIICGKKTQGLPGQKMSDIARSVRSPIKFNCENGKCGTCESLVNGRKVRICSYKVPAKGPVVVEKFR